MSVEFIDIPQNIDFCHNPLAFKVFAGDDTQAGVKAKLVMHPTYGPDMWFNIGESFIFEWEGNSETFTVVSDPDVSGNQITGQIDEETWEDGWDLMVEEMTNNEDINRDFTIYKFALTPGGQTIGIAFEARNKGNDFTITPDFTNLEYVEKYETFSWDGIDPLGYAFDYKVVSKLYAELEYNSNIFEPIPDLFFDPDENGHVIIYVNEVLKAYFTDITIPTSADDIIKINNSNVKRYYIKVAEYYGTPPEKVNETTSDTLITINGRLFYNQFPEHDFEGDLPTNKNYLTNAPIKINTWYAANQYLYFLKYGSGTTDLTLSVKIYYTDGTTETETPADFENAEQYDVFAIKVGAEALNLNSYSPEKIIYKYEISILDDDVQAGKTITYILIDKPYLGREFLYENEYGVMETLLTTGRQNYSIKVEKEEYRRFVPYNYNAGYKEYISEVQEARSAFEVNTGLKTASNIARLRELLKRENFYIRSGNDYIPCNIEAGSFKITDDADDMFSISFKYNYAFAE